MWGAQGGYEPVSTMLKAGYGGFSTGKISLTSSTNLYISVGQKGKTASESVVGMGVSVAGGWNGGGNGKTWVDDKIQSGGGGATSIQNSLIGDGQLKNYLNNKNNVIIVAGGGGGTGGSPFYTFLIESHGGDGGGFNGDSGAAQNTDWIGTGGTQLEGGICNASNTTVYQNSGFGIGQSVAGKSPNGTYGNSSGGGGGWYGGGGGEGLGGYGGGGSGYIGNSSLTHKYMVVYSGTTSTAENTKTILNAKVSSIATTDYAKSGDGYCKITWMPVL